MASELRRQAGRLDQPVEARRVVPRPTYDPEAFGRLSERIARFLGTGRFLVYQSAFIAIWIIWNTLPGVYHFDPYTFTFLTLILSLQAAYAAPLILLAQNRQDDRDRVNMEQDRQQSGQQLADIDFVARELAAVRLSLREVATRDFLRSELRTALEEEHSNGDAPRKEKKAKKRRGSDSGPDGSSDSSPNSGADGTPKRPSMPASGAAPAGAAGPVAPSGETSEPINPIGAADGGGVTPDGTPPG